MNSSTSSVPDTAYRPVFGSQMPNVAEQPRPTYHSQGNGRRAADGRGVYRGREVRLADHPQPLAYGPHMSDPYLEQQAKEAGGDGAIARLSRQLSQLAGDVAIGNQQNELMISLMERMVLLTEIIVARGDVRAQEVRPVSKAATRSPTSTPGGMAEVLPATSPAQQPLSLATTQSVPDHRSTDPHMVPALSDSYANLFDFVETPAAAATSHVQAEAVSAEGSSSGGVHRGTRSSIASPATKNKRGNSNEDERSEDSPREKRSTPTVVIATEKRKVGLDEYMGEWTAWRSARPVSPSVLQELTETRYVTIDEVRLDRQIKTNRTSGAIGRIPLKEYLELEMDDYLAVRRMARALYAQWLQPNVRLTRQDRDRLLACYHKIEHDFPLLGQCEEHWKARELVLQIIDNSIDEMKLQQKLQQARLQTGLAVEPRKRGRPRGTTAAVLEKRREQAGDEMPARRRRKMEEEEQEEEDNSKG